MPRIVWAAAVLASLAASARTGRGGCAGGARLDLGSLVGAGRSCGQAQRKRIRFACTMPGFLLRDAASERSVIQNASDKNASRRIKGRRLGVY